MASASMPSSILCLLSGSFSNRSSLPIASFVPHPRCTRPFRLRSCALKSEARYGRVGRRNAYEPDLLRKPMFTPLVKDLAENFDNGDEDWEGKGNECVDWDDRMFEDTVPLVAFVKMVLHSGKYESGARLSSQHEIIILERLLPYHPEYEKKIGCGIDYITIGYHADFEVSRCLFIVRKDGELIDFSYWKCLRGLIWTKYPFHAKSFIDRHFQQLIRYESRLVELKVA